MSDCCGSKYYSLKTSEMSGLTKEGKVVSASASASATSNISQSDADRIALEKSIDEVKIVLNSQIALVNTATDKNNGGNFHPPNPSFPNIQNPSVSTYYNTKSMIADGEYNNISAWQGIRYLGNDIYLMCGTTGPTPQTGYGLIYVGNMNCINGVTYSLNVPKNGGGFYTTSVYGPNYNINTGIYTFVGSYVDETGQTNGFAYSGTLDTDSLTNPNNFYYLPQPNYDITFFHSTNGTYLVGSSYSTLTMNSISYLWNFTVPNSQPILIEFPNSFTTTSYGLWDNDDGTFVIVGGYSYDKIDINPINVIIPFLAGFVVNYNVNNNTFYEWTTVNFPQNPVLTTHFEGIERIGDTNTYALCADVDDLQLTYTTGYYVTMNRNPNTGIFTINENWIEVKYNLSEDKGYSTANSVANNCLIGLFISPNNNQCFQVLIDSPDLSSTVNYSQDIIYDNQNVKFDNYIINSNIVYDNNTGIFHFTHGGLYLINLNIYLQNLNLAAAVFTIYYTVKGSTYNFTISQKGIDEMGTGTAHGLCLPCSFSCNFYPDDILYIKNVSGGELPLASNYVTKSVGALISINKL